jgi:hypothetical protein
MTERNQEVFGFHPTDDPLHGAQEGVCFHGYYRNYCYLPLDCFCGTIPLLAKLREAKRDATEGTVEAGSLYEKFYCARGEMENRIKEAQQDLFADRTSTHWMASNQLRLWFSAFAHLMLSVLRAEVLRGTDLAQATAGQIRLKLFKIAARVKISFRRIHLELAGAYPYRETFRRAWANLAAIPAG